jgi:ribosome-associated toxin RatA of RatAB toxin-antitoxin module
MRLSFEQKTGSGLRENIMKRIELIIALFITLVVSTFSWSSNSAWELVKSENEIDVFARKVEGTKIKQFRASTQMRTEVAKLIELIKDPEMCEQWVSQCVHSKLMSENGENQFSIYREINNPWPFKDNDYELQYNINQDADTKVVTITFNNVADGFHNDDCCKPIPMIQGQWQFKPTGDGLIDVSFLYHFDPGAGVPSGLVNSAFPEMPIEQLTKVRTLTQ